MIIVVFHQYILKGRGETYILLFQGYITSVPSQFLIVEKENFKRSGNKGNEKSYMEGLRLFITGMKNKILEYRENAGYQNMYLWIGHRELTVLIKLCVLNCCAITVEVPVGHTQVVSAHR